MQYQGDPELRDILAEFDLSEPRNAFGQYYCKLCLDTKCYDSREELWIEHSFKPLTEWVNKKLTDSSMLCFFQMPCKSCRVELVQEEKVEESAEGIFHCRRPGIKTKIQNYEVIHAISRVLGKMGGEFLIHKNKHNSQCS